MEPIEHNGPGFKYQVTVKERGSLSSGTTYNVDNWRNNSLEHSAQDPYMPFQVTVAARNSVSEANIKAKELTLYSYEDGKTRVYYLLLCIIFLLHCCFVFICRYKRIILN